MKGWVCRVCFHFMRRPDRSQIPPSEQPPLPSRSNGDASSFIDFDLGLCSECVPTCPHDRNNCFIPYTEYIAGTRRAFCRDCGAEVALRPSLW
jgi:hypothetical protein